MLSVALAALLGPVGTSVHALGLGEVVEQSALGEPLRFAIPVLVNADDLSSDELAPECFKLVPGESARSGELPQIAFGRAMLERNAAGVRVVVTSNAIAREPALSFTVQAGCRFKIRHEYTVLLDPPIIHEPAAHADSEASTSRRVASPPAPIRSSAAGAGRASSPRNAVRTKSSARDDGGKYIARSPARATAPAKQAASIVNHDSTPRLTVSRSAQDPSSGTAMSDIARGKSDEEIRREVEAETLVLQRRIAELSKTLERMEAELRDATAARESAERTVKAAQPQPEGSGLDPWLVSFLFGLIALALAAMLIRIRQASRPTLPPFARVEAGSAEDTPTAIGSGTEALFVQPRHTRVATPATPPESELHAPRVDQDDTFEEDLLRYAEQALAYTVLEREQPKVVAAVVRDWGNPKVIAYLRELLVNPRKGTRPFSQDAVSDLIFLQGLAMERAGYRSDDSPWQIELDRRSA